MEGLIELPVPRAVPPLIWPGSDNGLFRRWVAVIFLWAVLLGAIACLSVAALGAV